MTPRRGRLATAAATATAVALISGCSSGTGDSPTPGQSAHTAGSTAPTGNSGPVAGVSDAQAAQLCTDIEAQLQNWRTYTPTLGKGGLNTVVGSWATDNGMNLLELAGNRGQIDTITTLQCPQVRQGALDALEIPDLASGLIGF
ncbi:hypothetical protein ERC79_02380 [Rhodococcus sp. ABRD24]|uniref:hypothetical protein n=1 Tax=Rhodococcus sp. ABRD24 TaxID=2507582 RepID=UPI0010388866|nr:hypothetical protein [Rhodococcus sp. ABRD24]QBJ94937.1 hypothetical protein ERC79_02380 [Rhodococcus sp. ABRD24]